MSKRDEKIKSALDIALQKASKLGNLSAEEKQSIRNEELKGIGEALGKRYLHGLALRDLELELNSHRDEAHPLVAHYLLAFLTDAIEMSDPAGAERMLDALRHFSSDQENMGNIKSLFQEYKSAIEQAWQRNQDTLAAAKIKELKLKGISGSAIVPCVETSSQWLEIRRQLDSYYQEHLAQIKATFKQKLPL